MLLLIVGGAILCTSVIIGWNSYLKAIRDIGGIATETDQVAQISPECAPLLDALRINLAVCTDYVELKEESRKGPPLEREQEMRLLELPADCSRYSIQVSREAGNAQAKIPTVARRQLADVVDAKHEFQDSLLREEFPAARANFFSAIDAFRRACRSP
jgi:hypothetical protein